MASGSNVIVRAGFMALTDCAPIVVAHELGLDRKLGVCVEPVRLPSWAAMRDHLAFEKLECAHMLGGLTLAMHLGLGGLKTQMSVPLLLGLGGNAITISNELYDEALILTRNRPEFNRADSAKMLAAVVEKRKAEEKSPIRMAVVHAFSSHNYEVRAWLAHGGIDPDVDIELIVVPPPKMVDALKSGSIDGYCVGEPWSQLAVEAELGRIMATKADLYPNCPEKVLALRQSWSAGHPEVVSALVEVFADAMTWAAQPENQSDLARMLALPAYLDVDESVILHGLMCAPRLVTGDMRQPIEDYLSFGALGCGYPHPNAGLWLMMQMRRWGQVGVGLENIVEEIFDPSVIEQDERLSAQKKFQLRSVAKLPPFDGLDSTSMDVKVE